MVDRISSGLSLTGNGLRDWLVQRITSVILAIYVLMLAGIFLWHPAFDFFALRDLFNSTWMRMFSVIALLSLFLHAWVGIWTVITDYLKSIAMRIAAQTFVVLVLLIYLLWGIEILWG
jgi:succinate dehydrogenase / fumarate reductase, membrane anchor subunit